MRDIRELKYMQSLPLERKIEMTAERIDAWYQHYNGNVAISFSGGKDSTVLMHIARNHWMCEYDIKGVFVDTGLANGGYIPPKEDKKTSLLKLYTNFDRIKDMTIDELAEKFAIAELNTAMNFCIASAAEYSSVKAKRKRQWCKYLESEAEE